jgi:hypothetical protein
MNNYLHGRYADVVLGVLVLVLVVLCALWAVEYERLRRFEAANPHMFGAGHMPLGRAAVSPTDASTIESWMTFSYINFIYKLPPTYLQTSLSISDPLFPNLSISHYARDARLVPTAVLLQVQSAVQEYLKNNPS